MSTASIIQLYSDRSHYSREHRTELADLLRPYWKDASFSDDERRKMYGVSSEDFEVVNTPENADLAVVPMTWNYYLARRELSRAADFIQLARCANLPILSYVSGDEGVTVPPGFDDVYVVRASGFRSKKRERQTSQPVFFEDPLETYPELGTERPDDKGLRTVVSGQRSAVSGLASVGFCGQASLGPLKLVGDALRACLRNFSYYAGWRLPEPQPLYPPALLRARAMRALAQSPLVQTRFIARSHYRAGAREPASREETTRQFYQNIAQTDYTLCARGGGNFSKRFYETLGMGRIPVLIDTDCALPFEPGLDWDKYIVRVAREQLRSLPNTVAKHFATLGETGLAAAKQACRRLWEEKLTFAGFHRHLVQMIIASETRVQRFSFA